MPETTRSPSRLRVLVVDDHDVVHWGFRMMLARQPWVERCLSAHTGPQALQIAARYRPHVALVDLFIGEESGAQVCEQLTSAESRTRVLLISGAGEIAPQVARAAGASGFAYKNWSADRIAEAVYAVGRGRTLFPHNQRAQPNHGVGPLGLSQRDLTILKLIAAGASNPQIAAQLHLSKHTIKENASDLYRKLRVRNRVEAVQHAQRTGLLA